MMISRIIRNKKSYTPVVKDCFGSFILMLPSEKSFDKALSVSSKLRDKINDMNGYGKYST